MTQTDKTPQILDWEAIYLAIQTKLSDSQWLGSVEEAHGLLSALACRGVTDAEIRSKMYLMQLTDAGDIEAIEGLYGLIVRDLSAEDFVFQLLLAGDDQSLHQRIDGISDWCSGFLQGLYYDGEKIKQSLSPNARETLDDLLVISHMDNEAKQDEIAEFSLAEIVEYLRVATQLIFDELQPGTATSTPSIN